ncbi:MAG: tRNA dihydrouridine synthase DusB [Selenomonas ruminantium]|jgi:nifR3 family TIM-barrel protein|uniref:tRNA-dihydrouridine synthase n=1 Tax=Selenomonas ruminantium TaxID=971 RepID=A0A927WMK7_SELRU|nr:tRNA dihydrouridine synthase DusB [Selenomonas ruminantium]MBE6085957.1 tRNA dihydrouridine synthase DusB [Selenomonas ruminantium]
MQIGKFTFNEPVFLAPMAGVTDTAYRIIAHDMGCPLCYAEMVSSQGIHFRNERTLTMLESEPGERPLAMQIFANTPEMAAEAAKYVEDLGTADILDFNMGCPAPKIVKNGEGSALMRDPDKAYAILSAIRKAVKMPFTVKMRKGWDDEHVNVLEIAKIAEAAGVDAIAVHGRTREQFYSGKADWDIIAEVKKTVKVPVIANGDVRTCQDLQKILDVTGADGVMIGRGAQGNPWIFKQLTHFLRTGEVLPKPTMQERAEVIIRHLDLLLKYKGDYIGPREMRKHATWYTRGITYGAILRDKFNKAEKREDFIDIIEKYLLKPSP